MLIRLNVGCGAVGLWGCGAVMGAVTGPGQWGLVPCLCYKCRA